MKKNRENDCLLWWMTDRKKGGDPPGLVGEKERNGKTKKGFSSRARRPSLRREPGSMGAETNDAGREVSLKKEGTTDSRLYSRRRKGKESK